MIQCNGVSLKDIELKQFRTRNGDIVYDNIASLDIEVSTAFKVNGSLIPFNASKSPDFWSEHESFSLMYLWSMCIDGYLFSGRSLEDLLSFLEGFNDLLCGTFYIFIHNSSYEFQFLRNILDEMSVFARKKRKPLKFNWRNFEFRCSYMLTRLSLDTWANEKNLSVKKLTGQFDYTKLRTPKTHLTVLERDYSYNDVLVVVDGLQEYLDRYKHIYLIPLTQTSCIRKEVNKVMKSEYKARKKVADMTDVPIEIYRFMIDCFLGGYTHANIIFANRVIENMWDFDISSSYPWAMLSEFYPVSAWMEARGGFERFLYGERYCCMMEIELIDIDSIFFNTYISGSKCIEIEGAVYDNGRIISAKRVLMRVLDIDYEIIRKSYHIEKIEIKRLFYATKRRLPNSFRRYLLQLFIHKTTLKGILEQYTLYFKSKEELNGCYGMAVTRDITDEITYILNDWGKDELTELKYYKKVEDKLKKIWSLNMSYSQGIYVPAYGRNNLWYMVYKMDDLIGYMDTDSLKIAPPHDDVLSIINRYNDNVHKLQREIADELGVTYADFNPLDSKGKVHSIGTYERDDDIIKFKTLGAKRYICQYDDSKGIDWLKMTVSGVRKKAVYQLNSIDEFSDDLVFDIDSAQKLQLVYNDKQQPVLWNEGQYDEFYCTDKYSIVMYNIPYKMSVSPPYLLQIANVLDDKTKIFKRKVIV